MSGAVSVTEQNKVAIYCDGASRGNPGPAAYGVIAFRAGQEVPLEAFRNGKGKPMFCLAKSIGVHTNNEAEYFGIINALAKCVELKLTGITLYSDSELVIRQLKGEYKTKNAKLKPLFEKARALAEQVKPVLLHIPREKNRLADYLANSALDGKIPDSKCHDGR